MAAQCGVYLVSNCCKWINVNQPVNVWLIVSLREWDWARAIGHVWRILALGILRRICLHSAAPSNCQWHLHGIPCRHISIASKKSTRRCFDSVYVSSLSLLRLLVLTIGEALCFAHSSLCLVWSHTLCSCASSCNIRCGHIYWHLPIFLSFIFLF